MGRESERMLEAMYASYRTDEDKFVCSDCFSDPFLKKFVKQHEVQEVCNYCDPEKDEDECRAVPANIVLEYIESCVLKKYTDAENVRHSLDPRGRDAEELVCELDVLSDCDGGFREELEALFEGREWLPKRFYDENSTCDIFEKSWAGFKRLVIRISRFVFLKIQRDTSGMDHWEEQIDPYRILNWVHGLVSEFSLIRTPSRFQTISGSCVF